ncbi:hypothetical protein Acsp04_22110 [Actinomadura sp. NBRC 104425]|nr:hypothetical protein Acsp04_22110 [Actinomadura sp. NBRC 104425]
MPQAFQQDGHGPAGAGEQRVVEARDEQRDAHVRPHLPLAHTPRGHRRGRGAPGLGKVAARRVAGEGPDGGIWHS